MATPASTHNIPARFAPAARINRSLTASLEKRLLEAMARGAPRWITSDRLTALGLAAQFGAGFFYAVARWHRWALLLVIGCIALNWLGDSLDGTLARIRQQQRPRYGFYVDHVVDIFGATALMTGLACSRFVHWPIALLMLLAFLLLSAESYLAAHTLARFEMSQGFFGPTEIRILLIVGTLALLHSPWATVFDHRLLLFDIGGAIASGCMFATLVAVTTRHTIQLYREEPLP
ncbi:MAG TPA: CDP-alcohol phosphatidyltransferase family protein [Acidobacteriaceae bacterium]|nr:CDP-alcohol phosphatidyltransferase family protein [Acidobacteriaceae bacterium]